MRVINTGNKFKIFDNSMSVRHELELGTYLVRYNQDEGFYLESFAEMEVKEKMYGVHLTKVNKVLSSYQAFNRSLGVILSGAKGIGKSVFSRLLSERGKEVGLPTIIVDKYVPGISNFLNAIEQEVIVLFDEFEKVFIGGEGMHKQGAQTEMLPVFDGIAQGKKLFVITCNELRDLNEYLINRPGRFHYHFRFKYPTVEEVREYLEDKLDAKYYDQIDAVVRFSAMLDINYDCLRAIAFELNLGLSFEEAIADINILKVNEFYKSYNIKVELSGAPDNFSIESKISNLDLISGERIEDSFSIRYKDVYFSEALDIEFKKRDLVYDIKTNTFTVQNIKRHFDLDYISNQYCEDMKKLGGNENFKITKITYTPKPNIDSYAF